METENNWFSIEPVDHRIGCKKIWYKVISSIYSNQLQLTICEHAKGGEESDCLNHVFAVGHLSLLKQPIQNISLLRANNWKIFPSHFPSIQLGIISLLRQRLQIFSFDTALTCFDAFTLLLLHFEEHNINIQRLLVLRWSTHSDEPRNESDKSRCQLKDKSLQP